MFNGLTALGWGLVIFAISIGVGSVVLSKLGNSVGGDANVTVQYLLGQLGSSGLAGWAPAIIAVSVGMFIIGALAINTGGKQERAYWGVEKCLMV